MQTNTDAAVTALLTGSTALCYRSLARSGGWSRRMLLFLRCRAAHLSISLYQNCISWNDFSSVESYMRMAPRTGSTARGLLLAVEEEEAAVEEEEPEPELEAEGGAYSDWSVGRKRSAPLQSQIARVVFSLAEEDSENGRANSQSQANKQTRRLSSTCDRCMSVQLYCADLLSTHASGTNPLNDSSLRYISLPRVGTVLFTSAHDRRALQCPIGTSQSSASE